MEIRKIIKRNKNLEDFQKDKITVAIRKAMLSSEYDELEDAYKITDEVCKVLEERKEADKKYAPYVFV